MKKRKNYYKRTRKRYYIRNKKSYSYNKNESLSELRYLLVSLITATAITGIGFIDDAIWTIIMAVVGTITYEVVSVMYSWRLIRGKKAGRDAYAAVLIILILTGMLVYNGIIKIINWIFLWPLFVKILVPIILFLGIITTVILIKNKPKHKEKNNEPKEKDNKSNNAE